MRMSLPLKGQSLHVERGHLIIRSRARLRALSSAVLNGGLRNINSILIQNVPRNFRCESPESYVSRATSRYSLDAGMTAGFMTAAEPEDFGLSTCRFRKAKVTAVVTAGTSNSARVGERIKISKSKVGTVNIIVLTDARLTDNCLVNALQTATEAKTLAFKELDIRSSNTGDQATCTSTDSLMIATTNKGEVCKYAGVATKLGQSIAKTVNQAVKDAVIKHDGLDPGRQLLDRLRERGIRLKDLEEVFLESYVHHGAMGTKGHTRKTFRRCLKEASFDHNVAALVLAALRLEEDGRLGLIPGLSDREFLKDPVSLLADEIIGMAISNYVAGSKGLFEYARFDRKKPGILSRLGPFADDAIGALVAGASSNVYSRLLKRR